MGNIKKFRKKYQSPAHKWEKDRIPEEKELIREYGLKNKRELWIISSKLAKFKNQAKVAISSTTTQSAKEADQFLVKLRSLGLLTEASVLSDVLTLTQKDVLERRLQTIVFRLGFARSISQSRQFISHGHIKVNGKKLSSPSYLVKKSEESMITFVPNSSLAEADHPERVFIEKKVKVREVKKETRRGRKPTRFNNNSKEKAKNKK
ncbi:MAG: 30S ribosomal protein S4 [Candidatus Woesearchaeota archaeon]